jgi:hypothetical protein
VRAREKNGEIEGERAVEEGLFFPLTGTEPTTYVAGPARQTWGATSPGACPCAHAGGHLGTVAGQKLAGCLGA